MKFLVLPVTLFLVACGGSLSSEQRKKIHENMDAKSIKKISDAELTEAAFIFARTLTKIIETDKRSNQTKFWDSLELANHVQILFMKPSDSSLRRIERLVIDAYTGGGDLNNLGDNLQRMGRDSLLYTKPLMKERQDGSVEFTKALAIRIPKKQVILSMKE